jgi:hypothetical protein
MNPIKTKFRAVDAEDMEIIIARLTQNCVCICRPGTRWRQTPDYPKDSAAGVGRGSRKRLFKTSIQKLLKEAFAR